MTLPELTARGIGYSDLNLIYGQAAGSKNEWHVALALWNYKWDFEYQIPVGGGDSRSGGTKIDFLIKTVPSVTALFVDGEYWHRGLQKDIDKLVRLNVKRALQARYGTAPRVIEMSGSDTDTIELAKMAVLKEIGRR